MTLFRAFLEDTLGIPLYNFWLDVERYKDSLQSEPEESLRELRTKLFRYVDVVLCCNQALVLCYYCCGFIRIWGTMNLLPFHLPFHSPYPRIGSSFFKLSFSLVMEIKFLKMDGPTGCPSKCESQENIVIWYLTISTTQLWDTCGSRWNWSRVVVVALHIMLQVNI